MMHTEVPDVVLSELIHVSLFNWCFNLVQLGRSLRGGLTGCKRCNKVAASRDQWLPVSTCLVWRMSSSHEERWAEEMSHFVTVAKEMISV